MQKRRNRPDVRPLELDVCEAFKSAAQVFVSGREWKVGKNEKSERDSLGSFNVIVVGWRAKTRSATVSRTLEPSKWKKVGNQLVRQEIQWVVGVRGVAGSLNIRDVALADIFARFYDFFCCLH